MFLQFQADLDKFLEFKRLIDAGNAPSGQPRYLQEESFSSVKVIPYTQYKTMSTMEIQLMLRTWHLLITGMPTEVLEFDESGLQELTNLDSKVCIQGVSCLNNDVLLSFHCKTNPSPSSTTTCRLSFELVPWSMFSTWPAILTVLSLTGSLSRSPSAQSKRTISTVILRHGASRKAFGFVPRRLYIPLQKCDGDWHQRQVPGIGCTLIAMAWGLLLM